MANTPETFRDVGLLPFDLKAPDGVIRAAYSPASVIGQYIASLLVACMGIGAAFLFGVTTAFPVDIAGAIIPLLLCGFLIVKMTRNDCLWVELDCMTIRGRHLYTRRIVERSIADIREIRTVTIAHRSPEAVVAEKLLGRVRGMIIEFQDGRTFYISRNDPAMISAKELMEGIIYRLMEQRKIQLDVVELEGTPLVRRIY
jgi:hypothetical protein